MHTYEFSNVLHATGPEAGSVEGVIVKKVIGSFRVAYNGQLVDCAAPHSGKDGRRADARHGRREEGARRREQADDRAAGDDAWTGELAVGDRVAVQPINGGRGRIVAQLPRRNALARRGAGAAGGRHVHSQVIAANLDRVVAVMAAAQPAPKWNLLDRYLVSAEAAGIPALICLTKADLAQDRSGGLPDDVQAAIDDYRRIGYAVVVTSAADGHGLEALRAALHDGVSALIGKSGVGKTSLLNALEPGLGLRVKAVSAATEKGQHTTTNLELFALEGGGAVVDTPGMREFGLWQVDESDLAQHFPEMRAYIGRCRFGLDCRHDEEPGCAVRRAVMDGAIDPRRYRSFLRLRLDE